jgi:hypothetical protein
MLADVAADERDAEELEHTTRRRPAPASTHEEIPFGSLQEQSPAERLASGIGNQNFTQVVARMADGEGLLPDGAIHPDVTRAIAQMSASGGTAMPKQLSRKLERTHGDLSDAVIHTGPEAEQLSRAVNARAFTVGTHMFFGAGEFNPHTKAGVELAAHEAAHVVQQRGAPASGSLKVSTPGDAFEREADAASHAASASA